VFLTGSNLVVASGLMQKNSASVGGAVSGYSSSITLTAGTIIDSNIGTVYGGGLFLYERFLELVRSSIQGNTAKNGGGVAEMAASSITMSSGASVHQNTAASFGAGLWLQDRCSLTTTQGSISGNTAQEDGGGIYGDRYHQFPAHSFCVSVTILRKIFRIEIRARYLHSR